MPEDMSDRMPEDLPVRKCINVMVGIIRSEVIDIHIYVYITKYTHIYMYMYVCVCVMYVIAHTCETQNKIDYFSILCI